MSIRIDKTQFYMMMLGIVLVLLMLFSFNEAAAGLVFILAIAFALNPDKYIPYFMVLLILVYTDFLSLMSSVSTGDFPIDFKTSIIMGGIIILQNIGKHGRKELPIRIVMAILATSIFIAMFKSGQPFMKGFSSYLTRFFPLLLIYPLAEYLSDKDSKDIIIEFCIKITIFACLLFCLQYFIFGDRITLLNLEMRSRYNDESGFLMHVASPLFCFCLASILLKPDKRPKDWLEAALIISTIFFVSKTRIFMFAVVFTIIYCMIFYNRKISLLSRMGIVFIGAFCLILLMPQLSAYVSNTFFSTVVSQGEDYIRVREILWFNEQNSFPKILGLGIENRGFSASPYLLGVERYKYYVSDLGVIGMFFQYGLQGVIAFLGMLLVMRKQANLMRGSREAYMINYLILAVIITSISVSPVQWLVPIIIAFSRTDILCIRKNPENSYELV